MGFQIRNLMIKLSPDDEGFCGMESAFDPPSGCCDSSCGGSPGLFEDPNECEAPTNGGDPDETPVEAAYKGGSMGLVLLQQQLRQALSEQAL